MKILLLSDIHANFSALKALSCHIEKSDQVFCLGDLVGYNKEVNEVIDFVRANNIHSVMGNHDYYLLNEIKKKLRPQVLEGIKYAKENIRSDNLEWLANLPRFMSITLDNLKLYLCHGSPWDNLEEYIYPNSKKLSLLLGEPYDLIGLGHTHHPLYIQEQGVTIINPGSVGQSRHVKNKICAAQFCTQTRLATMIELDLHPTGQL